MHFKKILEIYGCTNRRLKEIFTAKENEADVKIRKRLEARITSRIHDGMKRSMKRATAMEAVDMAWDAPPIQDEIIPLMMWAQGRISKEAMAKAVADNKSLLAYTTANTDGTVTVNLPKIFEISISLVRSYVTRRHAAQATKYANLWPFFKYEPRGTDDIANLQADALSQVVEKMSDDYNYRHFFPQTDREKLLYGFSLVFPRQAWSKAIGYRPKKMNVEGEFAKEDVESYTTAEGLDFVNPHSGRCYWDTSAPLANINTNNGPRWVGYWDMCKYSDLAAGDQYFNLDSVSHGEKFVSLLNAHRTFFDFYFDPTVLKLPDITSSPADKNDRASLVGQYSGTNADNGVLHTQHFELINPKDEGIANYALPVWVRFTVMGDGTVVGAEWMPSIPAAYGGFNQHDGRERSISFAEELLPYQDQITNLCTQMLFNIRTGMVQLWMLDEDSLGPEMVKYLRDGSKVRDFLIEPKILTYSMSKLKELGIQDPRAAFSVVQAQVSQSVEQSYQAIMRLLGIIDRLANVSMNELGESNPREISATEAQEISSTTATMHTFISDGIDEQRAGVKRMIFESYVTNGPETFEAPVTGRYTSETLKAAGFKPARGEEPPPGVVLPAKIKISGKVSELIYTYAYDSRDGAERSSNPQAAQLLVQMAQMILGSEMLVKAIGRRRIYSLLNTIIRLSGAGWDLKIEMDPNEEEQIDGDTLNQLAEKVTQIEQFLMKMTAPQQAPAPQEAAPPPAQAPEEAMLQSPPPA